MGTAVYGGQYWPCVRALVLACVHEEPKHVVLRSRASVFAAEPASMQIARPRSACKRPASANITFQASSCLFGRVSDSLFAVMNPGAGGLTKTLRAVRRAVARSEENIGFRLELGISICSRRYRLLAPELHRMRMKALLERGGR